MADEMTRSELGVNILQTLNLANIVSDVFKYGEDEKESKNQVELLLAETNQILKDMQEFTVWCNKPPEEIIKEGIKRVPQITNTVYQWQRLGGLAAKSGYSVTNALFNQRINTIMSKNHFGAWSKAVIEAPDSYLVKQAQKWWNKAFALENLNERDSYIALNMNHYKADDILTNYREDFGYSKDDATFLMMVRYWQVGVPSPSEAFRLVKLGYWKEKDFKDMLMWGHGFQAKDAEAVFNLYHYQFGVGEIMNLSSLLPLDESWVTAKLTQAGVRTDDIPIFKAAIQKRVTRDEIRQLWSAVLSQYVNGYYTDAQLTTLLKGWGFLQAEIDIKLQVAKELKVKNCLSMTRDAQIYLYRQGAYAADDLFDALVTIGVDYLVSNAIVVQEAAKKGEIWENPNPI